ncbi:MAG: acetylxylan esterase [Acidobacteria bacterium]|jgi:dienelactone hydrolase|nr:acetylxylan esterase [Acidobacteriota bacterium]
MKISNKMLALCLFALIISFTVTTAAQNSLKNPEASKEVIEIKRLLKSVRTSGVPGVFPSDETRYAGTMKGIFYRGVPYKGKETRVFAWLSIPEVKPGTKCPAMVLVHGGGGTAYEYWVKRWNNKGYAAIAIDTNGQIPRRIENKKTKIMFHDFPGPNKSSVFSLENTEIMDQWPYHAAAAVILANSLISSFPQVDANRVGVTGISVGAYLAGIAASVDERFKCFVPVYGCGFWDECPPWAAKLQALGNNGQKWLNMWDVSLYLNEIKIPILWVDWVRDKDFPLPALQKSYNLPAGKQTLCVRSNWSHSHWQGMKVGEIAVFVESILTTEKPLAEIVEQGRDKQEAWLTYRSQVPIVKAVFNYTTDSCIWKDRQWKAFKGKLDTVNNKVLVTIPKGTTVYYIHLTDERKLIVSAPHVEINAEVAGVIP